MLLSRSVAERSAVEVVALLEETLVIHAQGKLKRSGRIGLCRQQAKGTGPKAQPRVAELNAVGHIEGFGPEYKVDRFAQWRRLANREVPVIYALSPDLSIRARLVAEEIPGDRRSVRIGGPGIAEASRVDNGLLLLSRLDVSNVDLFVASGHHVWADRASRRLRRRCY